MLAESITLVMAYYENGKMLDRHFEEWNKYPDFNFKIVLVDDGSQIDPALPHIQKIKFPLNLYRVKVDKPWNQNGARNLGMTFTKGWCLLTDMDHLLTVDQFSVLTRMNLDPETYYVPGRKRAVDKDWYKKHPNSYILTNDMYWKAGGYDETYCGFYGTDSTFRNALASVGNRVELDHKFYLTLFGREVIPDASTTNYGRKGTQFHLRRNPELTQRRKNKTPPIEPLNFPWERLI